MALGNKFLYHNAWIFYIIGISLLVLVLLIGVDINNPIIRNIPAKRIHENFSNYYTITNDNRL